MSAGRRSARNRAWSGCSRWTRTAASADARPGEAGTQLGEHRRSRLGPQGRRHGDSLGHVGVGRVRSRQADSRQQVERSQAQNCRTRAWPTTDAAAHQAGRRDEGVLHRRSRDARALGHPPRDRQGRVRLDCRAVGLRQVDAAVDSRPARFAERGSVPAERPAGRRAAGVRARARPQPRDRVHLPELQPDRRSDRVRERRAAADLSRHEVRRAQAARRSGARARRHGAPREAPAQPALRRSAAARRRRPRRRRRAAHPAGRRADGQPRLAQRRSGDGSAARAAPERRDHLHGHARSALRAPRRSQHPPVRRPRRRRAGGEARTSRTWLRGWD